MDNLYDKNNNLHNVYGKEDTFPEDLIISSVHNSEYLHKLGYAANEILLALIEKVFNNPNEKYRMFNISQDNTLVDDSNYLSGTIDYKITDFLYKHDKQFYINPNEDTHILPVTNNNLLFCICFHKTKSTISFEHIEIPTNINNIDYVNTIYTEYQACKETIPSQSILTACKNVIENNSNMITLSSDYHIIPAYIWSSNPNTPSERYQYDLRMGINSYMNL